MNINNCPENKVVTAENVEQAFDNYDKSKKIWKTMAFIAFFLMFLPFFTESLFFSLIEVGISMFLLGVAFFISDQKMKKLKATFKKYKEC